MKFKGKINLFLKKLLNKFVVRRFGFEDFLLEVDRLIFNKVMFFFVLLLRLSEIELRRG